MTTCPHCGEKFILKRTRKGTIIEKFRAIKTEKFISIHRLMVMFPEYSRDQLNSAAWQMVHHGAWYHSGVGKYSIHKHLPVEGEKISLDNQDDLCHTG